MSGSSCPPWETTPPAAPEPDPPAPSLPGPAGISEGEREIIERLERLDDRFARRLVEDRDKRRLIEDLNDRMRAAEEGVALEYLAPFLMGVARVVDRVDGHFLAVQQQEREPTEAEKRHLDLVHSLRSELLGLMEQHRVAEIGGSGSFDPAVHEIVELQGERGTGGVPLIVGLVRRGFRYGSRLLRPARVIARIGAPGEESGSR